jgi:hypothetical protein
LKRTSGFKRRRIESVLIRLSVSRSNPLRKCFRLRQTRDLLLPRLVSGEVNVENIDIAVEA